MLYLTIKEILCGGRRNEDINSKRDGNLCVCVCVCACHVCKLFKHPFAMQTAADLILFKNCWVLPCQMTFTSQRNEKRPRDNTSATTNSFLFVTLSFCVSVFQLNVNSKIRNEVCSPGFFFFCAALTWKVVRLKVMSSDKEQEKCNGNYRNLWSSWKFMVLPLLTQVALVDILIISIQIYWFFRTFQRF